MAWSNLQSGDTLITILHDLLITYYDKYTFHNKRLKSRVMDTRFWGPSGWKLFHLIAFDYDDHGQKSPVTVTSFLETLPFILPCKFCRSSLTDYFHQHPVEHHLKDKTMAKWMFTIHNCVNEKLRKQGLHPAPNPTFVSTKETYSDIRSKSWDMQLTLLWNFLFAVAYDHPKATVHAKPMPDCPKDVLRCKDDREKNKWNVLSWKKRTLWFRRFWSLLPDVLPSEIGHHWKLQQKKTPPQLDCRRSTLAWLWRMRCGLDTSFRDPYTSTCQAISKYSSDCGTSRGSITCRRKHTRRTKTHKNTKKTKTN